MPTWAWVLVGFTAGFLMMLIIAIIVILYNNPWRHL